MTHDKPPPQKTTPIIAVDGPAASGKGTIARALAEYFGYDYLDTGLLYRAVAFYGNEMSFIDAYDQSKAKSGEIDKIVIPNLIKIASDLTQSHLNAPELRGEKVATLASFISKIPEIRAALHEFQVNFADNPPDGRGAVLDGRDIGSVICPHADLKLYVTANVHIRAKRRFLELYQQGKEGVYAGILADLIARDHQDSTRALAPLRQSSDAILLDSSHMSREIALATAIEQGIICGLKPKSGKNLKSD
ncbi:MAG: (d)CMP kinase [Alphaproteobacteria bacterium]|nr:(d)CMP kinase [Alphaproteobacteria bacterium]